MGSILNEDLIDDEKLKELIPKYCQSNFLRNVEKDSLIPKIMRESLIKTTCMNATDEFFRCTQDYPISVAWSCQKQKNSLMECLGKYMKDEKYVKKVTDEYLTRREEFQIKKAKRKVLNALRQEKYEQ